MNIKKQIIWLFITFGLLLLVNNTFAAKDIMEVMFEPAKSFEKIIDLWNTKDAVGNEVFRESQQFWLEENAWKWCFVNGQLVPAATIQWQMKQVKYTWSESSFCQEILGGDQNVSAFDSSKQAPLIVRITKFLLRMTIVLAITMVLYNGIMRVIESAKWWEVKDAKDNLVLIIGWILLALSSVWFINLVSSITISSLNIAEWPWCKINWSMLPQWDELKQYVCEKAFDGKRYPNRVWNRCRVDFQTKWFDWGHWAPITTSEQISKCTELWWTFISK